MSGNVPASRLKELHDAVLAELGRKIVGQVEPMEQVLTCFFTGGTPRSCPKGADVGQCS